QRLADHMVPAVFMLVDRLPMTVNGKLDRAALPAPTSDRAALSDAYIAPATDLERLLADTWRHVLDLDQVGVHDNFFELGGDSIRAVQIIGEIERHGLAVSLGDFFGAPTVAGLAGRVRQAEQRRALLPFELLDDHERALLPDGIEDAYPMTATQLGMYLQAELNQGSNVYHNVNSFEVRGPLDLDAFVGAVEAATSRYAVLRTGFAIEGLVRPLQFVYPSAPVDVRHRDIGALPAAEQDEVVAQTIAAELAEPFALDRPPLIRFRLLRRGPDVFQLVVAESHLILDGWSFTSLLAEIWADHLSIAASGEPVHRPGLRGSFADFVRLEAQAVESPGAREFWLRRLGDAQPTRVGELAPAEGALTVRRRVVEIPPEVERGLRDLADSLGVPIKSVLMAAHARTVAALLGRRTIVTGMVTNGRPEGEDGTRLKGLFLNTVPVRVDLGGGSWRELVEAVYAGERELLPFRRYPLGRILRDGQRRELFDVAFHFVEFHEIKKLFGDGLLEDVRPDERSSENTHFRLLAAFSVHPPLNRLGLVLVHDETALAGHIDDLADAYLRALTALAFTPDRPYADHRVGTALEPLSLAGSVVVEGSLHGLFERWVGVSPDAVAVVGEGVEWSYR
ncbi:condensation domain-containing protein, partial [Microbispora sp. KK1-11]|uniref:condensation domain-containing protein n=1 Tax=Microbispora sp. KK1-11 TaxID=2053005 RepID=UPI00116C6346